MKENFPLSLATTLKWEGGYVDNPHDPGGATYEGITQVTYDNWRRAQGRTLRNVVLMAPDERDSIYQTRYWSPAHCDTLAPGVDMIVFDIAVNSGPGRVISWMLTKMGIQMRVERNIGLENALTWQQHMPKDPISAVRYFDQKRRRFWESLPIFKIFGRGWINRENDVFSKAMALALKRKFQTNGIGGR